MPLILNVIPRAKLMIVGGGSQLGEIENIARYSKHGSVIVTSEQPYEDIPIYMNLADICVCPFLITDTTRDIFPIKIIQYLACGKPVVSTSLDGIKAVIQGEEQGVVYDNNIDDMVGKIIWLFEFEAHRKRLGNNALNYVRAVHGYDRMVTQLEGELKNLVAIDDWAI